MSILKDYQAFNVKYEYDKKVVNMLDVSCQINRKSRSIVVEVA